MRLSARARALLRPRRNGRAQPLRPRRAGIGDAVAVHRPNLVVVAGSYLDDDAVARWAYAIRLAGGAVPVAVYRRGTDRVRMRSTGTGNLPAGAGAAQRRILEMMEADSVNVITAGHSRTAPRTASACTPLAAGPTARALRRIPRVRHRAPGPSHRTTATKVQGGLRALLMPGDTEIIRQ